MSRLRLVHGAVSGLSTLLVRIVRWAVFAILMYLIVAVNATIVLRACFGISLPWIMDSAQFVAPYLAFFAAAAAFSSESHPKMEFLFNKLPPHLKYTACVLIHAFTVALMGALCYFGWGYAQMGRAITITSMDFLTMYPFYLSLPIGFACMTIMSAERLLHAIIYQHPGSLAKEGA